VLSSTETSSSITVAPSPKVNVLVAPGSLPVPSQLAIEGIQASKPSNRPNIVQTFAGSAAICAVFETSVIPFSSLI
jgi:hypothetical protein